MQKQEIENINKLSKRKINWRILGENFVFFHEGDYYKMPSFIGKQIFYKNNDSYVQAKKNFELIKRYFGKVIKIADTEIEKNSDGHYIIKQKEIKGRILSKKDLAENYLLLSQFKKLIIINEIFWKKEGVYLDLLGSDFALRPNRVYNLITDGEKLYIFDFGLFEKEPQNYIFRLFSRLSTRIQILVIKWFWDK
ncbi:MAG: hypothetical protein Q9M94_03760 [Candidatus Gracilibacteria bacterium]|nr:hypothetical protein [Candidatus Gracilibacteria bacterium]